MLFRHIYVFVVPTICVSFERREYTPFSAHAAALSEEQLPFPRWLADFTGMNEWPGMDPPYIPLPFLELDNLPFNLLSWRHEQGVCTPILSSNLVCSFDCTNCVTSDDVHTCASLSQTFDDGPSPFTLELVDSLLVPVTFFSIGLNVVRFPSIYRRTADEGHLMGSHTWSHKFLPSLTNEEIVAQIEWSIWAMNATYGHIPKWFRPPYGGIDNRVRGIVRQFGMQLVLWDYDTFDWQLAAGEGPTTEEDLYRSVNEFLSRRGNKGLMLEHDSTEKSVLIGMRLFEQIGNDQMTVAQCAGGIEYMKVFDVSSASIKSLPS